MNAALQITLRCSLSRRQAQLYAALRRNLTLQDLLTLGRAAGGGGPAGRVGQPVVNAAASSRLMGLIMQMRKVGSKISSSSSSRAAAAAVRRR
jgi:hypothetical protein